MIATKVAEQLGRGASFKTPVVESTGTGGGFKLFCAGVGVNTPDMTNASRAIKPSEIASCVSHGVTEIAEVKIGFDGIVLASSKAAERLDVSLRSLWLALAKQVPDGKGGDVRLAGESIYAPDQDVHLLRKRIGMVFQKSNPFPKSIYENVAYGCRIQGVRDKAELDAIVEDALVRAALWSEVSDRLGDTATGLSGGQQQRLCIARAIATQPEVILFDEPCSALDPIATAKIEELMQDLKNDYTQVIVTHNMQQASRVSDFTAFLYLGELIEYGPTDSLFVKPQRQQTEDYITGRFG